MARSNSTPSQAAFPFVGILQLIFITLKLTNQITWSWLWVLSPIWITFSLIALLFVVALIGYTIANYRKGKYNGKTGR